MPNFKYKIPLQKNVSEESTISSNSFFTSGGEGENHNGPSPRKSTYGAYTQAGYKKVTEGPGATMGPGPKAGEEGVKDNVYVKKFKYTLVNQKALNKAAKGIEVKALWEAEDIDKFLEDMRITDPSKREFISSRLRAFDEIEEKLNKLIPLLQQAKHKTMDFYRSKPESYSIVYGTDLAKDYLNDLIELFKN
jgi:vacuolar-type H+-ATPase subunit I/STV1